MLPPPVIHAPAEATVATALFSRGESSRVKSPRRRSARNATKATTVAVMVTPMLQPVLRTT